MAPPLSVVAAAWPLDLFPLAVPGGLVDGDTGAFVLFPLTCCYVVPGLTF